MKRLLVLLGFVFVVLCAGYGAASRGEGITIGNGFINTGASQAVRDWIARERTEAEISMKEAKTEAGIEQSAKTGEIWRKVLFAVGIAAAVAAVAVGIGYAGKQVTPLAGQGVAALETALEIRKVKRLEVSLEIGAGTYSGHLLAEGYTKEELTDLVHQNPALDGPKVLALQKRVGDRGLRLLADRGEIQETLALIPEEEGEHD